MSLSISRADPVTILQSYLLTLDIDTDLSELVSTVADVGTDISYLLRNSSAEEIYGTTSEINIQGERQTKLDVISNDLLKNKLLSSNLVKAIASEEEDSSVAVNENAKYIIAFDPLDGSGNIDINGQVGTIFAIFNAKSDLKADDPEQFFQSGRDQVCAGYILYGARTELVLAISNSVCSFSLNKEREFELTSNHIKLPKQAHHFSINMSNFSSWNTACQQYIQELQQGEQGSRGRNFNMRWNGAMVGDIHRTLFNGGIFLYPNSYLQSTPKAKLRLLYEAFPMAMIAEFASGKAYAEHSPILDETLSALHQRTAVVIGSADEIDHYLSFQNKL